MKKILFPTAYSPLSEVAFQYALKLALYFDASITLLHVYENTSIFIPTSNELVDYIEDAKDYQHDQELEKLEKFALESIAKQFYNIPLTLIVLSGDVETEILTIQNQNKFDLVVMGMRRHNLSKRLLGNTTYFMIDNISCPLLLIPPMTRYLGVHKIIYGTVFGKHEFSAINRLLNWATVFGSNLHLVHVFQHKNKEEATAKMTQLLDEYQELKENETISFQLIEGKGALEINRYVELANADILAVHRNKQGFWQHILEGSLTKKLVEESTIPILVLKSQ